MKRRWLLAVVACLVAAGAAFWWGLLEPYQRNLDFCEATRAELQTLAKKRPANLSRKQWNNVVAWTLNGHGDILCAERYGIPRAEMVRFEAELRRRLQGPVDLATIDWIWDEFERLAPHNASIYSPKWRPTSPEKLREFEEGNVTWSLIIEVE